MDEWPVPDELYLQAREWLASDPDPATRQELGALIEAAPTDPDAAADLADRFAGRLEFGTAGLRGALGAGPNRMNRLTVRRAAAGLADWVLYNHEGSGAPLVVVGFDARHYSAQFAADTVDVLSGAEVVVRKLPEPLPTPVLAHTVRDLGATAGVMVTASHNPPQDNGYKVYAGWPTGSQIASPIDAEISAAIDAVGSGEGQGDEIAVGDGGRTFGTEPVQRYLDSVMVLPAGPDRDITITYTPLHGVGAATLQAAFARLGFPPPHLVAEQAVPDPDFPTVDFPNPEEPGALDLALAEAQHAGSDLVLANDPDADRLAVAVPGHGMLTGDELGGLLAEHVLAHTSGAERIVATTVVSSSLLSRIAAAHGLHCVETLTGFKWLARVGSDGEGDGAGDGPRCVFAYEEALGYCISADGKRPVADKDGIGSALVVAGMAASAKQEGRSLLDLRDDQMRRYGAHLTRPLTVPMDTPAAGAAVLQQLRAQPPQQLAELRVAQVQDLALGGDDLPPSDALRYWLEGYWLEGPVQGRVVVRPSGTEPKLKSYLEVVLPPRSDVAAARADGARFLDSLEEAVGALVTPQS